MTGTGTVLYAVDGDGVATVTLNRPEVLNALSEEMRRGFQAALERANADPAARAVVITAAGNRAFSAGQDLGESTAFTAETIGGHFRRLGATYGAIRALDKPSVVALNGVAAGFGLQAALHADVRVGHPGVRMGQPEVAAGIPSVVGMWIIREVVGLARAVELSLTCRLVPADECLEWGLLHHVVPADEVLPAARRIALEMAAWDPLAVRLSKERMRALTRAGWEETIEAAVRIQAEAFASGEPQRVAADFLARRSQRRGGQP